MSNFNPLTLALLLGILSILPMVAIATTSFLKISIVMSLVRNALGVQQVPPNIALYGMALILTVYVMAPVGQHIYNGFANDHKTMQMNHADIDEPINNHSQTLKKNFIDIKKTNIDHQDYFQIDDFIETVKKYVEPLRRFMLRNSRVEQRTFFVSTAKKMWGQEISQNVDEKDLIILIPSFVMSELKAAFQVGFLLYLPFVLIDLIVSNILLAMGMMMVSPVTISLPLKLFLFVMIDGWTRLIQGLVLSYI